MAKPNNTRCPKCRAKMKAEPLVIRCGRCGYKILLTMDRLTKKMFYGG